MSTLVPFSSVRELVREWQSTIEVVRRTFAEIVEAERRLNERLIGDDGHRVRIDASSYGYHDSFDAPEACIKRMRRDVWRTVIERLELKRILSVSRWAELERMVEKDELPEVTEESVSQLARSHMDHLDDILRESVCEVFDRLRPRANSRASGYKTNQVETIGRRVVLPYMVEQRICGGGFHTTYSREQSLVALENVLNALAGKGQVNRCWSGELGAAIEASGEAGVGETSLFRFRCCKNRNLHLEFKDTELLARFNAVAGGANLSAGKKPHDSGSNPSGPIVVRP